MQPVRKNHQRALQWFEKAAKLGNSAAQQYLEDRASPMLRTTLPTWHALTPIGRLGLQGDSSNRALDGTEWTESTATERFDANSYQPSLATTGQTTLAKLHNTDSGLTRPTLVPIGALVLSLLLILTMLCSVLRRWFRPLQRAPIVTSASSIFSDVSVEAQRRPHHSHDLGDDCSDSSEQQHLASPMALWTARHVGEWVCTLQGQASLVETLKAVFHALGIDGEELVMLTRDAIRCSHQELHAPSASSFCELVIAARDARLHEERASTAAHSNWLGGASAAGLHDLSLELVCPITGEIMADPVVCADGHSYERKAIECWLAKNDTSPRTNLRLRSKRIMPNHQLRAICHYFLRAPLAAVRIQSQRNFS